MSAPIDLVLSRLEPFKLHESGRDRWRACCPAHGGSNPFVLSIGVGEGEIVLLRCWAGCEVEQVAQALGLELQDLFPPRLDVGRHVAGPMQRRRMLPASQALALLGVEALTVFVVGADMHARRTISEADFERLALAVGRIDELRAEVDR